MLRRVAVGTGMPVVVIGFREAREKSRRLLGIGGLGQRHADGRGLLIRHLDDHGEFRFVAFGLSGDLIFSRLEAGDQKSSVVLAERDVRRVLIHVADGDANFAQRLTRKVARHAADHACCGRGRDAGYIVRDRRNGHEGRQYRDSRSIHTSPR